MKKLTDIINEDFTMGDNVIITQQQKKPQKYNYHPKDEELISLLKTLIKERGENADLNDIDTSQIKSFALLSRFIPIIGHIDISKWDVSNATDFRGMFENSSSFDCDLSEWDMSSAEDISNMFHNCYKFKGYGLDKWEISNNCRTYKAFDGCSFNPPVWYKE